jgi:hypothetical protein
VPRKKHSNDINIIMKFEELYNRIYVLEQDDESAPAEGVPMPEDFDDVKPAPMPTGDAVEAEVGSEQPVEMSSTEGLQTASTLKDYVVQLEEFADKINGMEGDSLQALVSKLDRPGTPFDGISSRTTSEIVRVAETLLSISEKLKSFIINASKK